MTKYIYQTLETMNLATDKACKKAGCGGTGWNKKFENALAEDGLTFLLITFKTKLNKDSPYMAPMPYEEEYKYPYPSLIVPFGFTLNDI